MKKQIFTLTLSAVLIALSSPVKAQQPKKVPKIGFLSSSSSPSEPFRHGLRELRCVEGQNITIENRLVAGKVARLPTLAEELLRGRSRCPS
jgi:putative ABC transport system substrate-binding protein